MTPFRDINSWHKAVRSCQESLDVAMRGDLPSTISDHESLALMRMLCQKLDDTLFWGFDLIRPKSTSTKSNLTLEDLGL